MQSAKSLFIYEGKTQFTIEYLWKTDGFIERLKFQMIVISTQHAGPSEATRCTEVAGFTGPDVTVPSSEEMNNPIAKGVVNKTRSEIAFGDWRAQSHTV